MLVRMSERPDTDSTHDAPHPLGGTRIVVVGGGAAGFFGAITAAESNPKATVTLLEKSAHVLAKVRISGGGRCNVTQACFDARELSKRYPRGGRTLIGPLTRFGPTDTIEWFESRGVKLKTEHDGRMFPVTDSSQSIIDCLVSAARKNRVRILTETGLKSAHLRDQGGFVLTLTNGTTLECDRLLWAGDDQKTFRLTTPSDYLKENPTQQMVSPSPSSWGNKGYWEVWLDHCNAWIYPHLHAAARRMTEMARKHDGTRDPLLLRTLRQLARELLLAQSSDWAFLMKTGTAVEYATKRTHDHVLRFTRIYESLASGAVDEGLLAACEDRDNIFPDVNWRHYL